MVNYTDYTDGPAKIDELERPASETDVIGIAAMIADLIDMGVFDFV